MRGFEDTTVFITEGGCCAALSPVAKEATVLFRRCADWVSAAACAAGFTSIFTAPETPPSGFSRGVCLYGGLVFLSPESLLDAYEFSVKNGGALLMADGETVGVMGDEAAIAEFITGGAPALKPFPLVNIAPIVRDTVSLAEANERARREQIAKRLQDGVLIPLPDGVVVSPDAAIEKGAVLLAGSIVIGGELAADARIGPHSYIENSRVGARSTVKFSTVLSSTVGADCSIGPYSQLRPDSVLGDGVKVGDFVEIKNSFVGDGTSLAHLTYIGDADVGRFCNFGCGTVIANYDGEKKPRATIKDYAFIGCNTNLVSPVTVGEAAFTAAGSTITKDVPDGALAVERGELRIKEGWGAKKLSSYIKKKKEGNAK